MYTIADGFTVNRQGEEVTFTVVVPGTFKMDLDQFVSIFLACSTGEHESVVRDRAKSLLNDDHTNTPYDTEKP